MIPDECSEGGKKLLKQNRSLSGVSSLSINEGKTWLKWKFGI